MVRKRTWMIYRRWNVPSSKCVYHCWRDLGFWVMISPVTDGLCRDACWLSTGSKRQKRSHTHFSSRVELHSLVTSGSSQSLLRRGHQWQPQRKVARGRVPGSNTEQKALLKYKKRLGSFPEHWHCWLCLQLSGNQFCCVSLNVLGTTSKGSDIFKTKYF